MPINLRGHKGTCCTTCANAAISAETGLPSKVLTGTFGRNFRNPPPPPPPFRSTEFGGNNRR